MIIIPAIDIIDGKCVRLTQGDYAEKKVYNENPLEVARSFEAAGITHLHLVDLDAAKSSHIINHRVLREITTHTKLKVDFGGGVKSDEDIRLAFDCGAQQVTVGSMAVKSPDVMKRWLQQYGPEKIILGADVKGEKIAVSGWQEESNVLLFDLIDYYSQYGIQYVICTDISKDGMLKGPSFELYEKVLKRFPKLKLIASGGVSKIADVYQLEQTNMYGCIIGKALYEGNIQLSQLKLKV